MISKFLRIINYFRDRRTINRRLDAIAMLDPVRRFEKLRYAQAALMMPAQNIRPAPAARPTSAR